MYPGITADPAADATLADAFALSSRLLPDDDAAEFLVTLSRLPAALAGARLRLRLGPTTVMAISLPPESRDAPLRFGPTRLPLWKLRRQRAFDVVVSSEGDAPPLRCAVTRLSGELLEALTLPSPEAFFDRIQLHHRRYKDPRLLMLGAISAYGRFADFEVRAAALTIPAHRLLERDFRRFDAHDLELMRWICDQGLDLVDEGAGLLARTASPKWTLVRWTVSLATVCGLLSICQDRLDHATRFFGVAASQTERVTISPVSALNLVNACFIHGLLLAAEGGLEQARDSLERGVRAFPICASAQNVMRNVWVLGDLLNVCKASRSCFLALGRLGLLQPKSEPQMKATDSIDLGQIQSPLQAILRAGRSPRLLAAVQDIAGRPLDPGIGG